MKIVRTRITKSVLLNSFGGTDTSTYTLEISIGLLGWKDVAHVTVKNGQDIKAAFKQKLNQMVDDAEM